MPHAKPTKAERPWRDMPDPRPCGSLGWNITKRGANAIKKMFRNDKTVITYGYSVHLNKSVSRIENICKIVPSA
jgi:hypothetical protein